ncbi:MAG TPA: hypothetical protein VM141_12840 [Planctomycetota bacterium]|nr:hypothetical protein [Planctomycetota bacterium]
MSIRKERLQLIRERHRKLILAPRERIQMEAFAEEWDDTTDFFCDTTTAKKIVVGEEEEE